MTVRIGRELPHLMRCDSASSPPPSGAASRPPHPGRLRLATSMCCWETTLCALCCFRKGMPCSSRWFGQVKGWRCEMGKNAMEEDPNAITCSLVALCARKVCKDAAPDSCCHPLVPASAALAAQRNGSRSPPRREARSSGGFSGAWFLQPQPVAAFTCHVMVNGRPEAARKHFQKQRLQRVSFATLGDTASGLAHFCSL